MQLSRFEFNNIGGANLFRIALDRIQQFWPSGLVWNSEINPDEFVFSNLLDRSAQFIRQNVEAHILNIDLAMLERGVLHLRRKRMLDWIAVHSETDCGFDIWPIL